MEEIRIVVEGEEKRVDIALSERIKEISRSEIKKNIIDGNLKVNDKIIKKASYKVKAGDIIEFKINDKPDFELKPQEIPLKIVYEDNEVMVVDKESGVVVHPGAGNYENTLVNALISLRPEIAKVGGEKRPGIVHRLDKDTSGLILIAKKNDVYLELQKQFSERKIEKSYVLIVKGSFEKKRGKIEFPIGRSTKNRKKISSKTNKPREAITFYKVRFQKKGFSLVEAFPKTGRTHQIRVHFSESGKPIIGDPLYGSAKKYFPRLALHSRKIVFFHPIKKHFLCVKTPIPEEFLDFFRKIGRTFN